MVKDIKSEVKKIFKKYCGSMTVHEFGNIWKELYEQLGIEGVPARFTWEEPYPGYHKIFAPLQFSDGTETDFKVVISYDQGDATNNYTLYVA